ncbi:MAG: DUF4230 domain-containing protein [Actinomycetota bacterium]
MTTLLDDRPGPAPAPDPASPTPEVVVRVVGEAGSGGAGRPPRRRGLGLRTLGVLAGLGAVAVALVLLAEAIGGFHVSLFETKRVDRSAPVVLKQLRDVSTFTAATGEFEATIDVEDDVDLLPAFVAGERTIFVGVGTVDAQVDFASIDKDAVAVGQDGSVAVTLPAPVLARPVVDPARSRVVDRDRGIVNRVADVFTDSPTSERGLYLQAQRRLAAAARGSELRARAEANTERMLRGLLGRLGYETVTVAFTGPAA